MIMAVGAAGAYGREMGDDAQWWVVITAATKAAAAAAALTTSFSMYADANDRSPASIS